MVERTRSRARALVAAVVVVCAAAVGATLLRGARSGPAPAAPPAPPRVPDVRVLSTAPGVERRAGAGEWVPARPGDGLAVADTIRTGRTGIAEIAIGETSHVTVAERSQLTMRELTAAVQRVGLARGRITVDVQPDGTRVVRVEDETGAARVSTSGGRVGVVATGAALSVATEQGHAVLESAGRAVEVPAGHQSSAWLGAEPVEATPVPRELLLRVVQAVAERRASICTVVQVDRGAEVLVDGAAVDVPPDGRVVVRVPTRAARRAAEVIVRDAGGRSERRRVPCWAEGDVSDLEVRWRAR